MTPHRDFRLNPARAIHVSGLIDVAMVSRLTLPLLKLQTESRDPITVYIDSPGGNVAAMETMIKLLRLSDQDGSPACRIITAVTNQAASAAADLLSSGDYSVAYPTSTILYHGVRRQGDFPITLELTSLLGSFLRRSNDRYAMELARKIQDRFAFRFVIARNQFAEIRRQAGPLTDLACFERYIEDQLSPVGKEVWKRASERHQRYRRIHEQVLRTARGENTLGVSRARIEAENIKALVEFEVGANEQNAEWSFTDGGIENLADDFFLLNEYVSSRGDERLLNWAVTFRHWILEPEQVAEIDDIGDEDQRAERLLEFVKPILEPLWSFFIAFCHALQRGENELTAEDAYWLGLVDEVVGYSLVSLRSLREFTPDPPANEHPGEAPAR